MYSFIHGILSDRKGGEIFTCFSLYHFCYIFLCFAVIAAILIVLRKKDAAVKDKAAEVFINIAFGLYVADFFLMPFAYEEIDIEKLPFHVCTAMCVMCFLSRHTRFLQKYRTHFALLGFISNLVYLIYPAGVMWHAVHPLCYRVVQTLIFHAVMTVYGLLTLLYDGADLTFKECRGDLFTVIGMTAWAVIGNALYTGSAGAYSGDYNWFFVLRDPFNMLDEKSARFIMPFLNIAIFFAVCVAVRLILHLIRAAKTKKPAETSAEA